MYALTSPKPGAFELAVSLNIALVASRSRFEYTRSNFPAPTALQHWMEIRSVREGRCGDDGVEIEC